MNLLLLYGNGGSQHRFAPFIKSLESKDTQIQIHIPELSGFEDRPLDKASNFVYWNTFLNEICKVVETKLEEDWVFYGQDVGAAILLELASRDWVFPNGYILRPKQVILHSCSKKASTKLFVSEGVIKSLMNKVFGDKNSWEKRFFQNPDNVSEERKKQFFEDQKNCKAFPIFTNMLTEEWYNGLKSKNWYKEFYFVWGLKEKQEEEERAIWKKDFPKSTFILVPEWSEYVMIEHPEKFTSKILEIISLEK